MKVLSKILTLVSLICFYLPGAGATATCPHRVVFLPQSHAPDEDYYTSDRNVEMDEQVANSQLRIADYIERFPGVPVFSEQAGYRDFSLSTIPREKTAALRSYFSSIFPRGLPTSSMMTAQQRQKLIDNGGDFVQLIRGKLSIIHKVVEDEETSNRLFAPINKWFASRPPANVPYPPEIGRLVYGEREKQALIQINKYFQNNPGQRDAILVYGANHNFGFYPEIFNPECVIVPPEFRSAWTGWFREGPGGFTQEKPLEQRRASKTVDASR